MNAADTVEVTRNLWQSWAVAGGSIVSAVLVLTVLAKIPGGRVVFKFLVSDPVARWVDRTIDRKLIDAMVIQSQTMQRTVRDEVRECIRPVHEEVQQINQAVNNVGLGTPPIKDRVTNLERGQEATHAQLSTIQGIVESLARRP